MAENWDTQGHSGAESFNDGCDTGNKAGGSSDTFAEGAGGQDEPGRIQEDKINKKKLAEQVFLAPSTHSNVLISLPGSKMMAKSYRSSFDPRKNQASSHTQLSRASL